MHDLTLVIPAKNEKESLPSVLQELEPFNFEILIVLEEDDKETINSVSNFNCRLVFQKNKGYGDALILGINEVNTNYFCIFNADGSFNPKEIKTMTLTRTNLINTILDRSNKFRTDLQVVFNTYTNSSIDSLSDKIEETIHRTNYNLCNRFLKNGRERVNLIGFIEIAHNNTHAHVFLKTNSKPPIIRPKPDPNSP